MKIKHVRFIKFGGDFIHWWNFLKYDILKQKTSNVLDLLFAFMRLKTRKKLLYGLWRPHTLLQNMSSLWYEFLVRFTKVYDPIKLWFYEEFLGFFENFSNFINMLNHTLLTWIMLRLNFASTIHKYMFYMDIYLWIKRNFHIPKHEKFFGKVSNYLIRPL